MNYIHWHDVHDRILRRRTGQELGYEVRMKSGESFAEVKRISSGSIVRLFHVYAGTRQRYDHVVDSVREAVGRIFDRSSKVNVEADEWEAVC